MARRDQYIKSKTDYVLRKKHAVTSVGTIYENDYMTIIPDDGMFSDDIAMFSDSNFKFRVRTDRNLKKRHFGGNWIRPNEDDEVWTGENCSAITQTSETKIELKPDYTSIKNFAYYGSAQKLIEATMRDVVSRYPGGICYLGNLALSGDTIVIDGSKYTRVSNEVDIDIWTKGVSYDSVEMPMKYLSASYDKYVYGQDGIPVTSIEIENFEVCPNSIIAKTIIHGTGNTKTTLYTYLKDTGEHVVVVKGLGGDRGIPIIRVNEKLFEEMYDALDDFEKMLLNRRSNPMFKARLETPYLSDDGYYYKLEDYIWPSISDSQKRFYTPDMSSTRFAAYVARLQQVAMIHDELDSDNLWRMMTHDSLKNLDWTFKVNAEGDTDDLTNFDSSRLEAAIHLYGRQFDDLKRYADNVKAVNAVTYDEKNNLPDYFLTDSAENDGWEAYHVGPSEDDDVVTNVLFSGTSLSGYSSSDANVSFMRRLAINSNYIQSLKGTKRGLEVILSLFGMQSGATGAGSYSIKEHVAIAKQFPSLGDMLVCLSYWDDYYFDDNRVKGWPVVPVITGETEEGYLIPWYDKKEDYRAKEFYFQCKGGWESTTEKKIDLPITSIDSISPMGDIGIYGETFQYMKYAEDLNELTGLTTTKLKENAICYVNNISTLANEGYNASPDDAEEYPDMPFSHYFILKTLDLSPHVGFVDNEYYHCYGWRNVFECEFNGESALTEDGLRVLYAESTKTVENGNNPHAGYGSYDSGMTYLEYYKHLFKHELENNEFSALNEEDDAEMLDRIKEFGFSGCNIVEDSEKCHVFFNTNDPHVRSLIGLDAPLLGSSELIQTSNEKDNDVIDAASVYDEYFIPEQESSITQKYDECAAFSVINVKNIEVVFSTGGNDYLKEYIENVVIKYLEQMMPSTAIFSYSFDETPYLSDDEP